MKEKYITITGTKHYYDLKPFRIGRKITCVKEPENSYDSEAICAKVKHIGKVGYVENSVYTVINGTQSAGRIYEKVGKKFKAEVMFVTPSGVICRVLPKNKKKGELTEPEISMKLREQQVMSKSERNRGDEDNLKMNESEV